MIQPVRAFVQARMTSRRFPGKVLAPFRGEPLIRRVLGVLEAALPGVAVTVVTSTDCTDDPLAAYLETAGASVFRGPLERVFDRFRLCMVSHPCEWVLRVCADSPLLNPHVLEAVVHRAEGSDADLVTNIFPRTFPKGHSAEMIRVSRYLQIDVKVLSDQDQEHVTPYYYRNPKQFRIANVASGDSRLAQMNVAVETVEDLWRLERLSEKEIRGLWNEALPASRG